MTGNIISFVSSKGGSGKTITSCAIGTFLSQLGFKVLLVDTDASTNGMTLLYLEQLLGKRRESKIKSTSDKGLFEINQEYSPSIVEISPLLSFVPATFKLFNTDDAPIDNYKIGLNRVLSVANKYDFVILDAQAGSDIYAKIAAHLADQIVIVSEYDPVSAQGIDRIKILFSEVIDPSSTWTLFNKVLPEFAPFIGEGLSIARYLPPIVWDAEVVRAFSRRDIAINFDSPNPYTITISQICASLFPEKVGLAIENWGRKTVSASTEPLHKELENLNKAENEFISSKRIGNIWFNVANIFILLIVFDSLLLSASFFFIDRETGASSLMALLNYFEKGNNSIVLYAVFAVLNFTMATVISLSNYSTNKNIKKDEIETYARISNQKKQIIASIDARNAVQKSIENVGFYEKLRRDRSQV